MWLAESAQLSNVQLTGPVAIGAGVTLTNVTLGPYTSIGEGCTLRDSDVSGSVVLPECTLEGVHLTDSLLGHRCQVVHQVGESPLPCTVMLADDSRWVSGHN